MNRGSASHNIFEAPTSTRACPESRPAPAGVFAPTSACRRSLDNKDRRDKRDEGIERGKPLCPDWQVTVQPDQLLEDGRTVVPGYVQIDDVHAWSKSAEKLRAEGFDVPDFSGLPRGRYWVRDITTDLTDATDGQRRAA